jgi:hypothetical protein
MNPQSSLEHNILNYIMETLDYKGDERATKGALGSARGGDGGGRRWEIEAAAAGSPRDERCCKSFHSLYFSYLCTHLTLFFQNNVGQENHKRKFQKVRKMVSEKYKSLKVHFNSFMVFMKH